MGFSKEFKIGVFAVAVLLLSWWGIKWLGGQNLLHKSNIYYAYYEDVAGLQVSSRVTLRGVNVGNVKAIELGRDSVKVTLSVESKYTALIPENSVAEICSAGLMGGVEISLLQGDATDNALPNSTLQGRIQPDMLGELSSKGTELMEGMTKTVESVNRLLAQSSEQFTSFVANLERVSSSIDSIVATTAGDIKGVMADIEEFTSVLATSADNIERTIENFDALVADVAEKEIVAELNTTLESLSATLNALNEGDGTAAKLLSDKALYESLTKAGDNLGVLLEDLKCNPTRYVHFSLFGGNADKR